MNVEKLAQAAKETLLQFGGDEYIPELLVQFTDDSLAYFLLDDFPGGEFDPTRLKQAYLWMKGQQCRRTHPGKVVRELAIASETWVVRMEPGEARDFAFPSQSPRRQEHLSIWYYQVQQHVLSVHAWEIVNRQAAVDLVPVEREEGERWRIKNALFPAFLAGYQDRPYKPGLTVETRV